LNPLETIRLEGKRGTHHTPQQRAHHQSRQRDTPSWRWLSVVPSSPRSLGCPARDPSQSAHHGSPASTNTVATKSDIGFGTVGAMRCKREEGRGRGYLGRIDLGRLLRMSRMRSSTSSWVRCTSWEDIGHASHHAQGVLMCNTLIFGKF
jgi:hypothetical protein